MKRILRPLIYVLAAVYFLVDAVFMAVAKPVSDWLAGHIVLRRLRAWIQSLRPYPSLALFSVPVIILEPVKPVAAYLAATGQIMSSAVMLIVGELLKLVLVERLFSLTAASHRGLANHPVGKSCHPAIHGADEKIRRRGVSAILKGARTATSSAARRLANTA